MIRLIVADDHTIVRAGIKQIIDSEPDLVVADEATKGSELLNKVKAHKYDVAILDIKLPGRSGLEILKELKTHKQELPVLILSMHPEDQYAVRALKAGASGYLSKDGDPRELINAIRKVAAGGKYITPSVAEILAYDLGNGTRKPPHEKLSDREYEVMQLIAGGKTITAIADQLHLSVNTISTYRARILEKMNIKNNAELMHYAIKKGLVD